MKFYITSSYHIIVSGFFEAGDSFLFYHQKIKVQHFDLYFRKKKSKKKKRESRRERKKREREVGMIEREREREVIRWASASQPASKCGSSLNNCIKLIKATSKSSDDKKRVPSSVYEKVDRGGRGAALDAATRAK